MHHDPAGSHLPISSKLWRTVLTWASRPLWAEPPPEECPLVLGPDGNRVSHGPSKIDESVQGVLAAYAVALRVPVSFHVAPQRFSRPRQDPGLHVHAFALPTVPVLFGFWPRVMLTNLPFAHGVPLREGATWAMAPGFQLGRGRPLLDAEGGTVAEQMGRNLYCLFDLLGQEPVRVPLFLRRHLDLGLPHQVAELSREAGCPIEAMRERVGRLRQETDGLVRAARTSRLERERLAYARICHGRVLEEIGSLQAEIALLEDGVEELARGITAAMRRLQDGQRRLQRNEARAEPGAPAAEVGTDATPELVDLRWEGQIVHAVTRPLHVEYEGRAFCLGAFQLELSLDGDVRILNRTHRIGKEDHPHVSAGRPRLSNVREGVAKLVGEGQVSEALEVLVDFLRTVRPGEWRLPIWAWPEIPSEEPHGVSATA